MASLDYLRYINYKSRRAEGVAQCQHVLAKPESLSAAPST